MSRRWFPHLRRQVVAAAEEGAAAADAVYGAVAAFGLARS